MNHGELWAGAAKSSGSSINLLLSPQMFHVPSGLSIDNDQKHIKYVWKTNTTQESQELHFTKMKLMLD